MNWTVKQLAQAFLKHVWQDKSLFDSIILDKKSLFISKFWSVLCFYFKIQQKLSTAFHLQIDR